MLTFNLKKEWFEKIKNGEKTHEYRVMSPYWAKRIFNAIRKDKCFNLKCKFACGYPKANEKEKWLKANIVRITHYVWGQDTDLKIDKFVYDIEFELINEVKNAD